MAPNTQNVSDNDILANNEDFRESWLEYHEDRLLEQREVFFNENCFYCGKTFPTALKCFSHERFCKEGKFERFTCQDCGINFKTVKFLKQHKRRHKKPGGFFCSACNAKFTSATARIQHRMIEHREFQCQICFIKYGNPTEYVNHIMTHHNSSNVTPPEEEPLENIAMEDFVIQKPLAIDPLATEFRISGESSYLISEQLELKQEQEDEEVDFSFPADDFQHESDLDVSPGNNFTETNQTLSNDNSSTKTGEKYFCKYCQKPFSRRFTLKRHEKSNCTKREFVQPQKPRCKRCRRIFDKEILEEHEKTCRVTCSICGQSFGKSIYLEKHMKIDHYSGSNLRLNTENELEVPGRKEHACPYCTSIFTRRFTLLRHLRQNCRQKKKGLKKYCCKVCKKGFDSIELLQEHEQTCNIACLICNTSFENKTNLSLHMIVHQTTKSNPYKRSMILGRHANQKFNRTLNLKKERNLKSFQKKNGRQHYCDYCKRNYARSYTLKLHKMKYCPGRSRLVNSRSSGVPEGASIADQTIHQNIPILNLPALNIKSEENTDQSTSNCDFQPIVMIQPLDIHDIHRTLYGKTSHHTEISKDNYNMSQMLGVHQNNLIENLPTSNQQLEATNDQVQQVQQKRSQTENKKHTCEYCHKSFTRSFTLKRHMTGYCGRFIGILRCKVCKGHFEDLQHLEEHEKNCRFICAICTKSFRKRNYLCEHIKWFHQHFRKCSKCDMKVKTKLDQEIHKLTDCGKNSTYECKTCKKTFSLESKLRYHLAVVHRNKYKIESCHLCKNSFATKNMLDVHIQSEHTQKYDEFKCHLCPSIYAKEASYVQHLKETHDVEIERPSGKHKCNYCRKRYCNKESLDKHVKKYHTFNGKIKLKCTHCNELFNDKNSMHEHNRTAHKDKYVCHICNKSFKRNHTLPHHMKAKHSDEKVTYKMEYLCGKCGKGFRSRTSHQDHERTNCGQICLYQCDVCQRKCATRGSLKTHKLIHTGIKAFSCSYCEKTFRTPSGKRHHERCHTGEKPFKCTYCDSAFSRQESLLTHLTVHTGFKRFMCSGCGQRFTCISNLQSHRRSHATTCGLVPNCTKVMGPMEAPLIAKLDTGNEIPDL